MTPEEAQKLPNGLYVLHWATLGGGASLASVGRMASGSVWFAPINWIHVPSLSWSLVDRVTLLLEQADLRAWEAGDLEEPLEHVVLAAKQLAADARAGHAVHLGNLICRVDALERTQQLETSTK